MPLRGLPIRRIEIDRTVDRGSYSAAGRPDFRRRRWRLDMRGL